MKSGLKILVVMVLMFCFAKTCYAYDVVCKYQKDDNEIAIEYDEVVNKYMFSYNYDEYTKNMNVSSIKSGQTGNSIFEAALFLDEESANNLKDANNIKCPTYAFWDTDEKDFCFSNSNSGCSQISGHNFIQYNKTIDYTEGKIEDVLVCETQSSGSSYTAGDTKFKITIDSANSVNISYSSNNSVWQELPYSSDYVRVKNDIGTDTSAFFYNNNLNQAITDRRNFDELFYELSENATKCPDMKFTYYVGNYYVYLENSFDDEFILGEQETDKPSNDNDNDNDDNLTEDLNPDFDFRAEDCESYLGNPIDKGSPAYYLAFIFDLMKYAAIVILIVLTIIEFVKATASSNQDAMKKAIQNSIKRLLIAVIIFFVPTLVMFILQLFGITSATTCGIS